MKRTALLLPLALLAACSRSEPEAVPANDAGTATVEELGPVNEPAIEPLPAPANVAEPTNTVDVPREQARSEDEQMLDDASATGMTSRSTRGDERTTDDAPVDDAMSNQQGE